MTDATASPVSRRPGILLALVCLLLLGLLPVLASARPAGFDGLTFATWLTVWQLTCALPLYLWGLRQERARPRPPKAATGSRRGASLIALASGAMFGLSTWLYVVAAEHAGPVSLALALQAYPVFALIWEALFLGKRQTLGELLCTLLILATLVYLTTGGTFQIDDLSWWSALALTIPLLWSIAHLLLRHLLVRHRVSPSQVTVTRLGVSLAFLLLAVLLSGDLSQLLAAAQDFAFQQAAFLMGLAYYLELILWFYAMRSIDVSLASLITVPAPAVTMLLAALALGAPVLSYQIVALLLIIAGLCGLLWAGRKRASA